MPHHDFRGLRVIVAHPRDSNGELLFRYLQRLGCAVELLWPPTEKLVRDIDVLVCLMDKQADRMLESCSSSAAVAVVGIADPNDPGTLRMLNDLTPHAVLNRPFELSAVLSNLIVARSNLRYQRRLLSKVAKLEETLRSFRMVERAKTILMEQRRIAEPEAYAYLREQAMRKRVPIGAIASVVVDSREVLFPEMD
jgi:AmiR/NasT family two-component response regulator